MGQLYLTHQNQYTTVDVASRSVLNTSWSMSGYPLLGGNTEEYEKGVINTFADRSQTEIENALDSYLDSGAGTSLSRTTTDYILLDVEHPINMRWIGELLDPAHANYDPSANGYPGFRDGFILRGQIARAEFPNAKLGWYGPVFTNGKGNLGPTQTRSVNGYNQMIDDGVYNDMDFLTPVLYLRWGPNDGSLWEEWNTTYINAVLDQAELMATRIGGNIELFPYFTFVVFNSPTASNDHLKQISYASLQEIIDVCEARDIQRFTLWWDWQGACCTFPASMGSLTIEDYLDNLTFGGVSGSAPVYSSSEVGLSAANKLIVTFDKVLQSPTSDYSSGFSVNIGSISSAARGTNEATIEFTLSGNITEAQSLTIAYNSASGNIESQDTTPIAMATFSAQAVTNNVNDAAPTFVSGEVLPSANTVKVIFSENMESPTNNLVDGFSMTINGGSATISSGELQPDNSDLRLIYTPLVQQDDVVLLSYNATLGDITDQHANGQNLALATFTNASITNPIMNEDTGIVLSARLRLQPGS